MVGSQSSLANAGSQLTGVFTQEQQALNSTVQIAQRADLQFKNMVGSESALASSVTGVSGGLTQQNTLLQQSSTSATNAATAQKSLGQSFQTTALGIAFLATGVLGIITSYTNLERAQLGVDKAQKTVLSTQAKLTSATDAHTKAVKQFGEGSKQAADTLVKLQAATAGHTNAVEAARLKQQSFNEQLVETAVNVGPQIISVIAGIAQVYSTITQNWSSLISIGTKLAGLFGLQTAEQVKNTAATVANSAANVTNTGTVEANTAARISNSKALSLIIPGLGAAAGAFAGLQIAQEAQNQTGFTSNTIWSNFGKTIGDAIPQLRGALTATGEWAKGVEVWANNIRASIGLGKNYSDVNFQIADSQKAGTAAAGEQGNALKTLGDAFGTLADSAQKGWDRIVTGAQKAGADATTAWDGFVQNTQQVVAPVVSFFTGLWSQIVADAQTAASNIGVALNGFVNFVQDAFNAVYTKLGLDKLATQAVTVGQGIAGGIMSLVGGIQDAFSQVWQKLGLEKLIEAARGVGEAAGKALTDAINKAKEAITPTNQIAGKTGFGTDIQPAPFIPPGNVVPTRGPAEAGGPATLPKAPPQTAPTGIGIELPSLDKLGKAATQTGAQLQGALTKGADAACLCLIPYVSMCYVYMYAIVCMYV